MPVQPDGLMAATCSSDAAPHGMGSWPAAQRSLRCYCEGQRGGGGGGEIRGSRRTIPNLHVWTRFFFFFVCWDTQRDCTGRCGGGVKSDTVVALQSVLESDDEAWEREGRDGHEGSPSPDKPEPEPASCAHPLPTAIRAAATVSSEARCVAHNGP